LDNPFLELPHIDRFKEGARRAALVGSDCSTTAVLPSCIQCSPFHFVKYQK
jgi:hypothetical protein